MTAREAGLDFKVGAPVIFRHYPQRLQSISHDELFWSIVRKHWVEECAGMLLALCDHPLSPVLWHLAQPMIDPIYRIGTKELCRGPRPETSRQLDDALLWIKRLKWKEICGPRSLPENNKYGSPIYKSSDFVL